MAPSRAYITPAAPSPSAQAASQLGRHRQACADQWAALTAIRAGRAAGPASAALVWSPEEHAAAVALVHAWAERVPAAAGFLRAGVRPSPGACDTPADRLGHEPTGGTGGGAALALCGALHGEGTPRLWARGDGTPASAAQSEAGAHRLATAQVGTLVAAAQAAERAGDGAAAEALLRTSAWVCGCRGARKAEEALIEAFAEQSDVHAAYGESILEAADKEDKARDSREATGGDAGARGAAACVTRLAALTSADSPKQSATAALQLVEALACRRVSNAARLQPHLIVACWRDGKVDAVRRAAASALVWLSRSRRASGWMVGLGHETLRPLLARAVALHAACGLSTPWAIDDSHGGEAGEEETGLCLGDGDR